MIPVGRRLVSPARLSRGDARNLGERAFAFLTAADAVVCQRTCANESVPRYRDAREPPEGFLSSFAPTLKGLEPQEEETVTFAPSPWVCFRVGGKPLTRCRRVYICGRGMTPQSTLPPF